MVTAKEFVEQLQNAYHSGKTGLVVGTEKESVDDSVVNAVFYARPNAKTNFFLFAGLQYDARPASNPQLKFYKLNGLAKILRDVPISAKVSPNTTGVLETLELGIADWAGIYRWINSKQKSTVKTQKPVGIYFSVNEQNGTCTFDHIVIESKFYSGRAENVRNVTELEGSITQMSIQNVATGRNFSPHRVESAVEFLKRSYSDLIQHQSTK